MRVNFIFSNRLFCLFVLLLSTFSLCAESPVFDVVFHGNEGDVVRKIQANQPIGTLLVTTTCDAQFQSFEGWTTATALTDNTQAPELVSASTAVTSRLDLYPVFSDAKFKLTNENSYFADGDKIVIAAAAYNYALGVVQNEKNRGCGRIKKNRTDNTITFGNDVQVLTLQAVGTDYALFDGIGYLNRGEDEDILVRLDSFDELGSWTIHPYDDYTNIRQHGYINYSPAEHVFSWYKSSHKHEHVVVYKKSVPSRYNICVADDYIRTVTFYINESMQTTVDVYRGNSLGSFPEIKLESNDTSRPTLIGWTTSATIGENTRLFLASEPVYDDVTLYPVFGNVDDKLVDTWDLVTDASELTVGDKIIIASKDYELAMETTEEYKRSFVDIIKGENTIEWYETNVQILTLVEGESSGTFALQIGSSEYLNAKSEGNLKASDEIKDDESWTITTTSDGAASIMANEKIIRYNSEEFTFGSYESGGLDVSIYKLHKANIDDWVVVSDQTPKNITIDSGKKLSITQSIEGGIDTLIIRSYLDDAGELEIGDNVQLSVAKVILEKTISDERYFFFSLPFDCKIADIEAIDDSGTKLTYATSATEGDYVINHYDQTRSTTTGKAWKELIGTNHTLNANQGYIIGYFTTSPCVVVKFPSVGAETISFPTTETLDYTDSWSAGNTQNSTNGFNLIGAPYYERMKGESTLMPDLVTIPNTDGKTYTQTEYSSANIASFASFFVQTTKAPIFTVAETHTLAPMMRANETLEKVVIALSDANEKIDKTTIINNPNATTDYEIGSDLVKWIGYAEIPQIYSIQGDDILAFNSFAIDASTIVPLGVYAPIAGKYTFALDPKSRGNLQNWVLYDNETATETYLVNDNLVVYLDKGTYENRFELRRQQRVTTDCTSLSASDITVWCSDGVINVTNLPNNSVVCIYDMSGRMIHISTKIDSLSVYSLVNRGVYNVVVRSADIVASFKVIY